MNDRRPILQLIKKIIRKAKDGQAYYHYGVEYSSDQEKPWYKVYIGWSKEGVQPLQFSENTKAKLLKEMEHYLINSNRIDVNIRWHEALIEANERAIALHKERLNVYRKVVEDVKQGNITKKTVEHFTKPEEPDETVHSEE